MTTVRVTGGVLNIETGEGPPNSPGYPDNSLPGVEGPVDPGFGLPLPPVTIWPRPPHIGGGPLPPTYPVDPDYGLPIPPTVWPRPPKPIGPDQGLPPIPVSPEHPIYLPAPGAPDNSLPLPPGGVWPPLPPEIQGEILALVWLVGVGYRWTVIDTDLKPSQPLPPTPGDERPDNSLPGEQPGVDNSLPGGGGGRPPHVSNRPPGSRPPRPDQGLPPTPEPKG